MSIGGAPDAAQGSGGGALGKRRVGEAKLSPETDREQTRTQRVLHRLAGAEVGGEGKGRDELGEAIIAVLAGRHQRAMGACIRRSTAFHTSAMVMPSMQSGCHRVGRT